jgi:hypothetical protein
MIPYACLMKLVTRDLERCLQSLALFFKFYFALLMYPANHPNTIPTTHNGIIDYLPQLQSATFGIESLETIVIN